MAMTGKNRIMIYGPKTDGPTFQFRTAADEALAISIPHTEAAGAHAPAFRPFAKDDIDGSIDSKGSVVPDHAISAWRCVSSS
jgi:hypothetical protein